MTTNTKEVIIGAYDLHVHSGPDVIQRKLDDHEMAERLQAAGMKGYALKSHVSSTAGRAKLINKLYPQVNAIGAISLNNAVGGLNPMAVEMAARDGAKIVWMPTIDATNEIEHLAHSKPEKMPFFAKLYQELLAKGKAAPSISILEGSQLKKVVYDILDIIVEHDLVLATGHLGKEEIFVLTKEAFQVGVKKVIITHPNFPSTDLNKDEQKELSDMGGIIEHCFTTPYTNKITWERMYDEIRHLGPEHSNCKAGRTARGDRSCKTQNAKGR